MGVARVGLNGLRKKQRWVAMGYGGGSLGAVVDPALAVLQSSVLWLEAGDPGGDVQRVQNKGLGGSALDAVFGSTAGVDANDSLLLTHTGTNYLYLPGTAGDYASVPDAAVLDGWGTPAVEIVVRCGADDWTPAVLGVILSKGITGSQAYQLYVNTNGTLTFQATEVGNSFQSGTTSSVPGFVDGVAYWLRCRRTAGGAATIEWAADQSTEPSSWTQIGASAQAATNVADSSDLLRVGRNGDGNPWAGKVFRSIVRSSPGGTTVFDADFTANTNQSSFTESSSNAATVTINRSTNGRKAAMVTRTVILHGPDDYLEVPSHALLNFEAGDSLTAVAVVRNWASNVDWGAILAKHTAGAANPGWSLYNESTTDQVTAQIADTVVQSTAVRAYTPGVASLRSIIRDVTGDTVSVGVGATLATSTDNTTGSLSNSSPFRVGAWSSGPNLDMELFAVAVFRSALTPAQLALIATYYGV